MSDHRPLLLGHRGARQYAPENTFAAFDLALQHGCDGFEFDVRYTRDSRAVVCHDPSYEGREILASAFTDLSGPGGVSLPCADEVIRRFAPRAFLDIELKVAGELGTILAALAEAPGADRFVISSFVPEVIEAAYARMQGLPLGYICDDANQLARWRTLPVSAVMLHEDLATSTTLDELHRAGKKTFVWTVNREERMREFAELGVAGIISDDTRLLAQVFSAARRY